MCGGVSHHGSMSARLPWPKVAYQGWLGTQVGNTDWWRYTEYVQVYTGALVFRYTTDGSSLVIIYFSCLRKRKMCRFKQRQIQYVMTDSFHKLSIC